MNREIKFRAWDKYANPNKMIQPKEGDFIAWGAPSNWRKCYEVMQYTGLKDKNGKEIYEGDVFKYWWEEEANGEGGTTHHYDYLQVEYIGGCFWAGNETLCDFLKIDDEYELVGNIYENPNLIK